MLQKMWNESWADIGAKISGDVLFGKLNNAYSDEQRKYHTLQHITECLEKFHNYRHLASDATAVEMAIWFHDSIYNVKGSNNEEKSADWACAALTEAEVDSKRVSTIRDLILATKHSALPETQDQALLVDIDLSILGAGSERFGEYESQIRLEYNWVPEPVYKQKRIQILSQFEARKPIYSTPEIRNCLERRAHLNIQMSIQKLSG